MNITETIDLTPSWETCVRIYCAVLRNPEAELSAIESAESELLRLARFVDNQKGKAK